MVNVRTGHNIFISRRDAVVDRVRIDAAPSRAGSTRFGCVRTRQRERYKALRGPVSFS